MSDKTFKSAQDYRNTATEEDDQELLQYIKESPYPSKAFKNEKYGFSYTTAKTLLKEKGLYDPNSFTTEESKTFAIAVMPQETYKARSFQISESNANRLDTMYNDYSQYRKQAIFNKLLDDVLKFYGY